VKNLKREFIVTVGETLTMESIAPRIAAR